jgi:MFS family permease
MFAALGLGGMLWLVPWLRRVSCIPATRADACCLGPSLADILRRRQAWGTFIGHFCVNYTWYFVLSWLPLYLTRERHYSTAAMAFYGALPFWGIAAVCAGFGWVSDRMIQRGANLTRVRIGFVAGGMLASTLMLPACLIPQEALSMTLLTAGCLSLGLVSSNFVAISQTLAGPVAAGRWMGLQNGIGNLAGIVGPYATGLMVAATGSFLLAFLAAGIAAVLAACAYLFVVREVAPVDWAA